jgi:hypothetical protein
VRHPVTVAVAVPGLRYQSGFHVFASGERGNKLTVDDEVRKLELVVEVAREVWG